MGNKTKFKLIDISLPSLTLLRTLSNISIISYDYTLDLDSNDVFYMSLVLEPKRK